LRGEGPGKGKRGGWKVTCGLSNLGESVGKGAGGGEKHIVVGLSENPFQEPKFGGLGEGGGAGVCETGGLYIFFRFVEKGKWEKMDQKRVCLGSKLEGGGE